MQFGTIYLVIGTQPTVYKIDHWSIFFREKMLASTLAPNSAKLLNDAEGLAYKIKINHSRIMHFITNV